MDQAPGIRKAEALGTRGQTNWQSEGACNVWIPMTCFEVVVVISHFND